MQAVNELSRLLREGSAEGKPSKCRELLPIWMRDQRSPPEAGIRNSLTMLPPCLRAVKRWPPGLQGHPGALPPAAQRDVDVSRAVPSGSCRPPGCWRRRADVIDCGDGATAVSLGLMTATNGLWSSRWGVLV